MDRSAFIFIWLKLMSRLVTARFSNASLERITAPIDWNIRISLEKEEDIPARETLLDRVFGLERFQKTSKNYA